jgi:hypothetical protein
MAVRPRLGRIGPSSLLLLMVVTTQPAREEAARFARRPPSLFARRLPAHSKVAIPPWAPRAHPPARPGAKARTRVNGLPCKLLLWLDSTRPHRASLPPDTPPTLHHGPGDGLGPQWTPRVLLLGDRLIPLRPIPCSSKRSGQAHALA